MLNDHSMYEHIVDDELFQGVIGMLECMHHIDYAMAITNSVTTR